MLLLEDIENGECYIDGVNQSSVVANIWII